jgi:hypothetical protein
MREKKGDAQGGKAPRVDSEFAALIPPLSKEELQRLELSLLKEGCRDPLIVWKEEGILLDGHNRLNLCKKHDTPFRTHEVSLPSRDAARSYVVELQLGRRNLNPEAASYLRGKRYEGEKQPLGGDRTSEGAVDQNDRLDTAKRLAQEYKVGEATIRRDAKFVRAVDGIVENCGNDAKHLILSRDSGLRRGQVLKIATMSPKEQEKIIAELRQEGKLVRKKRRRVKRASITLPTEPSKFVDTLLRRFSPEEAAEVAKLLGQALKAQNSGSGTEAGKATRRRNEESEK